MPPVRSRAADGWLLRRQGSGVRRPDRDPSLECLVVRDRLARDAQPAVHLLAAHLHPAGPGLSDQQVAVRRVAAQHQPALAARHHGHVAADQEGEAAEHLLLGHGGRGQEAADPLGELLVVGHVRILAPWTDSGAYPSNGS
jgi:hypothetical protein